MLFCVEKSHKKIPDQGLMKKVLFLILAIMALAYTLAFAGQSVDCVSTGVLSSSAVVIARPGKLMDCSVYTDGTHQVTVTFYDHATSGSGHILQEIIVPGVS